MQVSLTRLALAASLSSALFAQSPITTLFASNNGGAAGGCTYFNVDVLDPAGITVFNVDLNCGQAAGDPIGCSIWTAAGVAWDAVDPVSGLATHQDQTLWTQVAAGTGVSAGTDGASAVCLSATGGFFLAPGSYSMAVVMDANTSHRYTNGDGTNQSFATAEVTMDLGGGANTPFGSGVFQPRVWNGSLFYNSGTTVGNCLPNASTESFGTGCYTEYSSIYEYVNSGADDLAGYKISGTPNGSGGFDISVTPGSGFAAPLGSQAVTLGDDAEFDTSLLPNPGTLGMWIGSNGWMATGGGNSTGFAPSVATMLNNPNTAVYAWTDLQPNAAGSVFYREFNGVATAIFLDVPGWNQPTELNSIKIDIDTNTGGWSVEIDEVGAGNPEDMLVGYSVGGASLDPGASDFVFGGFATSVPVHEMMPAGPHDLVGQRLTGVQDGVGGIIVTRTPGAGFGVPLGSQLLAGIGDDDVFDVSTIGGSLGMFIGSNGWMADAPGNSTGFAPSVATMENNPSLAIYAWTDLQPDANEAAGIGGLYYVENGTVATAIYDGIWGWNTQDENDILISCDVSNGSWAMEFGNIGAGNPEDMLVAYNNPPAAAGPSTAVDWTVVTTGAPLGPIGAADQAGLALTSNNPSLGTSWDMTCSDMEAGAQGAFFFFGSSAINPGIDLGVIGAPGCFAYTSNDLPSTLVLGSGSVTTSIAIPNNPALAGAQLTVQAASTSSQNAFGAATSNGLTGTVGL